MLKARSLPMVILAILCMALASCGPTIYYLGDNYAASNKIEVFYDEKDITRKYRAIGKMTNDKMIDYDAEIVKAKMIEKAKQVGGDGIIFTDIGVERSGTDGDRLAVKATLIKYL